MLDGDPDPQGCNGSLKAKSSRSSVVIALDIIENEFNTISPIMMLTSPRQGNQGGCPFFAWTSLVAVAVCAQL